MKQKNIHPSNHEKDIGGAATSLEGYPVGLRKTLSKYQTQDKKAVAQQLLYEAFSIFLVTHQDQNPRKIIEILSELEEFGQRTYKNFLRKKNGMEIDEAIHGLPELKGALSMWLLTMQPDPILKETSNIFCDPESQCLP